MAVDHRGVSPRRLLPYCDEFLGIFILISEVEQFYGTSRLIVAYISLPSLAFSLVALVYGAHRWAPRRRLGLIGIMLAMGLRRNDPLVQAVRAYYTQ